MKKLLAITLALVLALSMSAIAFAASTDVKEGGTNDWTGDKALITKDFPEGEGSVEAEVWVVINSDNQLPDNPGDVDADDATYKVEIDATGAVFTYTFKGAYNTETHLYDGGEWDKPSADIVITNHSNTSLDITAAWKDGTDDSVEGLVATFNGVTATLGTAQLKLDSAVITEENQDTYEVPSKTLTVAVEGTPTVYEGEFLLDHVKLTIKGTTTVSP